MFTKPSTRVPEVAQAIIPVRPMTPDTAALGSPRQTLGRRFPSRRTFGYRFPSRRTFGYRYPSRRTFGRYTPSRRTFGRYLP